MDGRVHDGCLRQRPESVKRHRVYSPEYLSYAYEHSGIGYSEMTYYEITRSESGEISVEVRWELVPTIYAETWSNNVSQKNVVLAAIVVNGKAYQMAEVRNNIIETCIEKPGMASQVIEILDDVIANLYIKQRAEELEKAK